MVNKPKRYESKENLDLIKELPCTICGHFDVDVHHWKTQGAGGGDQLSNLMPLCRAHHTEVHSMGAKTFYEKNYDRITDFRIKFDIPPLETKWLLD